MKFIRKESTNFFIPEAGNALEGKKVLVYSQEFNETNSIELETIFNGTKKFIITFYKGNIDYSASNSFDNISDKRRIIWIDNFKSKTFNDASVISFETNNQVFQIAKLSLGGGIYLNPSINSKQIVAFNNSKCCIEITCTKKEFEFQANKAKILFKSIEIPLGKINKVDDGFQTKFPEKLGSILFKSEQFQDVPLQFSSPFLKKGKDEEGNSIILPPILLHYFENKSFKNNVNQLITYYPFKETDNLENSEYKSYIEYYLKDGSSVNWNGVDDKAFQYSVKEFNCFRSILTKLKHNNIFIFTPDEGVKNGKIILHPQIPKEKNKNIVQILGYSGTERLEFSSESIELTFNNSLGILINDTTDGLDTVTGSKTFIPASNYKSYNLDSEKSPIFKNIASAGLAEIDYDSIEFLDKFDKPVIVSDPLPIIPTLSFKDNPELFELEEVFKKIRLKAHKEAKAKKVNKSAEEIEYVNSPIDYITPQGFQKTSNGYEFISNESGFKFSLENIDTNLDLSLRKDQVFFVLTPALFNEYRKKVTNAKINATFAINKELDPKLEFVVDLMSSYSSTTPTDSESIIIFKFHKEKLSTLVNDSKRWTNEGLLNYNLEAVKSAIDDNIKFKDDYFENSILEDKDWNGILILNVPISDSRNLPPIFTGLSSSQNFYEKKISAGSNKNQLNEVLKFQYAAFPINKTKIENGKIEINSTSFFGLIDYNPFTNAVNAHEDYKTLSTHLKPKKPENSNHHDETEDYQFLLSKLFVEFRNSSINHFSAGAFIRIPKLFDDSVQLKAFPITNKDESYPPYQVSGENLIRLDGSYYKNSSGEGEISFSGAMNGHIGFDKAIIESLELRKLGFSIVDKNKDEYRFDIDVKVNFSKSLVEIKDLFSFDELDFQNIGLHFAFDKINIPLPKFDLSKLIVLPKIDFSGNGFLRSFPIRLSHFQNFRLPVIPVGDKFNFGKPDFDFFPIKVPSIENFKWPDWKPETFGNLFSFVFDFDLGTLGNLGALKDLKGQLLIGWTFKGGFAIGFKLNGPSTEEIHLDLFGALKLDAKLKLCSFNIGVKKSYFLRLVNTRLTIFGTVLPPKDYQVDGIIYANPFDENGGKTAWFIATLNNKKLLLGLGQRVGIDLDGINKVDDGIAAIKEVFEVNIPDCNDTNSTGPITTFYKPERNWLIASEKILPDGWPIDLKFIFNDPDLYGIHLGFGEFLKGFYIDILYKKLSDSLGVYSTEIQLPDDIRNQDLGGASMQLPNIGIEIYTNGDWKADVGFPKNGNDWSRSGFLQLNTAPPFVGWFGFYLKKSNVPSLTLFGDIKLKDVNIIQAGFAMRVGLGAYLNKGILYIGASLSVYGILEGAFAFKKDNGLQALFPDHFAVLGRVGAIAEIVGYVDFKIVKAAVRISLRAEFGLLLIYLGEKVTDTDSSGRVLRTWNEGIQPVKVYVEGEVIVAISVTLFCVKFFRKKWCLVVRFKFNAYVRFEYTIGGGNSSSSLVAKQPLKLTDGDKLTTYNWELGSLDKIPMVFIPTFTRRNENGKEQTILVSNFYIPFFGVKIDNEEFKPSKSNIFKDKIIHPFLFDLITKTKEVLGIDQVKYEYIREILSVGTLNGNKVNITVPNYRPKFIDSVNDENWESNLEKEFLLKKYPEIDELAEFKKSIGFEDCMNLSSNPNKNKCPYRAIPAPISKKIIVNGNPIDGFDLKIEGLVSEDIKIPINNIYKSQDYINYLETYFNDFKTQFVERNNPKGNALVDPTLFDLQEDFIIPEFFKLAALLTLEKAYNKANPKEKNGEEYNPFVSLENGDLVFNTGLEPSKTIPTNDNIDEIIGQLNYFYNSGLRLPKDEKENNEQTISINELIGQQKVIMPIDKPDDDAWKKVEISINDHKITDNILGKEGEGRKESVEGMWKFINDLEKTDLTELKKEFEQVKFIRPYKLINVTLAVQSNHKKIFSNDKEINRFYEIPKKLFKHGFTNASKFQFELTAAQYENTSVKSQKDEVKASSFLADEKKLGVAKCINVEIQIKPSSTKDGKVLLELKNVLAEDLTLITLLNENGFTIDNISFYGNKEEEGQPKLIKLTDSGVTIIKTNLSPRTAPPIFNLESANKLVDSENHNLYVEDSDINKSNFIRLVWEALTTNTGGYYLAFDGSFDDFKDLKEIVISFETKEKEVPYYFNTLKIGNIDSIEITEKSNSVNKDLFTLLNDNKIYLYIEQLKQDKVDVLEYHPTMPAHDFGFELLKTQSAKPELQQYLPLEFGLKNISENKPILNHDKVLPLMPSGPFEAKQQDSSWDLVLDKDGKRTEDPNGKLVYSHVTPLNIQDPEDKNSHRNINRYATVGKEYELNLGIRDIYGFRTNVDFNDEKYTHYYFDKLIPVEAWPLLKFSYWFDSLNESNNLKWKITGFYDIRQILDLAAIPRDGDGEYNYRYQFDDLISTQDIEQIESSTKGVLTALYNIVAQLTDENTELLITKRETTKNEDKKEIKDKIIALIKDIDSLINDKKIPKASDSLDFKLTTTGLKDDQIEEAFNFEISLARKSKNTIDKAEDNNYTTSEIPHNFRDLNSKVSIWEYDTVQVVTTKIQASNGTGSNSALKDLNKAVKDKTKLYSLAISVDENLDKVIHLINEKTLKQLKVKSDYLENGKIKANKSYLGIKPISNKLWSGSYFHNNVTKEFTNIDLDKSFRIVLEKIDELLSKDSIASKLTANVLTGEKPQDLFEKLIAAKKKIAESVLSNKVDWVIDKKVDSSKAIKELREITLNKLTNFYAYDGAVALEVEGLEIPSGYRLSIGLETVKDYNLISSKINDSKWNIFFDQEESVNNGILEFSIKPQITHIEKDIKTLKYGKNDSEIEKSTWIQLIDPIEPEVKEYKVQDWKKIIREFPLKPIIIKHEAVQSNSDVNMENIWSIDSDTKLPKAGQWEYRLSIENKKDGFKPNDRIIIKLLLNKKNNLFKNKDMLFEFIAYWSGEISNIEKEFSWIDFVYDIDKNFNQKNLVNEIPHDFNKSQDLTIELYKTNNNIWNIERKDLGNGLTASLPDANNPEIVIEGFNIFNYKQQLFSVLSIIKVQRNKWVENDSFKYETESVQPASPATPLIKYYKPLGITRSENFNEKVFVNKGLPYKATAKYLIDIDASFPKDSARSLPIIPIRQIESNGSSIENPDAIFSTFDKTNGYFAFTYTIYNSSVTNGDLPIFYAETIFKSKK